MGSTRRRFTDEYKAQAVAFVIYDGRSIAEVSGNIGVAEATLGRWVKKARESGELAGVSPLRGIHLTGPSQVSTLPRPAT